MPYRTLPALALTEAERATLTQWTRRATTEIYTSLFVGSVRWCIRDRLCDALVP
jgi:hypothetical protein